MADQPVVVLDYDAIRKLAADEAERFAEAIAEQRFRGLQSKLGRQLAEKDQTIRELRERLAAYEGGKTND